MVILRALCGLKRGLLCRHRALPLPVARWCPQLFGAPARVPDPGEGPGLLCQLTSLAALGLTGSSLLFIDGNDGVFRDSVTSAKVNRNSLVPA